MYVGESSRSLYERAREHWEDASKLKEGSHIARHWANKHSEDIIPPDFQFRVIKKHRSALERQVHEAVHISKVGSLNDRL